ncbi:MAG: hypothetical protein GQ582_13420 [Methyloprofundus sp.]|nr:hypothetical protein [Methyloprofundus sp.]
MTLNLTKITQTKASEITALFELEEQGEALLTEEISPANFMQALLEEEDYLDLVSFLAYALPKREATWWACLAARNHLNEQSSDDEQKAVELAEAWVYDPTPENCQATSAAAEAAGLETAVGWAAMSAFWSGDNISPIEDNVVKPADDLYAKAVVGAVMLACVLGEAEKIQEKYQLLTQQGINIASGGNGKIDSD